MLPGKDRRRRLVPTVNVIKRKVPEQKAFQETNKSPKISSPTTLTVGLPFLKISSPTHQVASLLQKISSPLHKSVSTSKTQSLSPIQKDISSGSLHTAVQTINPPLPRDPTIKVKSPARVVNTPKPVLQYREGFPVHTNVSQLKHYPPQKKVYSPAHKQHAQHGTEYYHLQTATKSQSESNISQLKRDVTQDTTDFEKELPSQSDLTNFPSKTQLGPNSSEVVNTDKPLSQRPKVNIKKTPDGSTKMFILSPEELKIMGINLESLGPPDTNKKKMEKPKNVQKNQPKIDSSTQTVSAGFKLVNVKKTLFNKLTTKQNLVHTNDRNEISYENVKQNSPQKISKRIESCSKIENNEKKIVNVKSPPLSKPIEKKSLDMETAAYIKNYLIFSPKEGISNYIEGYKKISTNNLNENNQLTYHTSARNSESEKKTPSNSSSIVKSLISVTPHVQYNYVKSPVPNRNTIAHVNASASASGAYESTLQNSNLHDVSRVATDVQFDCVSQNNLDDYANESCNIIEDDFSENCNNYYVEEQCTVANNSSLNTENSQPLENNGIIANVESAPASNSCDGENVNMMVNYRNIEMIFKSLSKSIIVSESGELLPVNDFYENQQSMQSGNAEKCPDTNTQVKDNTGSFKNKENLYNGSVKVGVSNLHKNSPQSQMKQYISPKTFKSYGNLKTNRPVSSQKHSPEKSSSFKVHSNSPECSNLFYGNPSTCEVCVESKDSLHDRIKSFSNTTNTKVQESKATSNLTVNPQQKIVEFLKVFHSAKTKNLKNVHSPVMEPKSPSLIKTENNVLDGVDKPGGSVKTVNYVPDIPENLHNLTTCGEINKPHQFQDENQIEKCSRKIIERPLENLLVYGGKSVEKSTKKDISDIKCEFNTFDILPSQMVDYNFDQYSSPKENVLSEVNVLSNDASYNGGVTYKNTDVRKMVSAYVAAEDKNCEKLTACLPEINERYRTLKTYSRKGKGKLKTKMIDLPSTSDEQQVIDVLSDMSTGLLNPFMDEFDEIDSVSLARMSAINNNSSYRNKLTGSNYFCSDDEANISDLGKISKDNNLLIEDKTAEVNKVDVKAIVSAECSKSDGKEVKIHSTPDLVQLSSLKDNLNMVDVTENMNRREENSITVNSDSLQATITELTCENSSVTIENYLTKEGMDANNETSVNESASPMKDLSDFGHDGHADDYLIDIPLINSEISSVDLQECNDTQIHEIHKIAESLMEIQDIHIESHDSETTDTMEVDDTQTNLNNALVEKYNNDTTEEGKRESISILTVTDSNKAGYFDETSLNDVPSYPSRLTNSINDSHCTNSLLESLKIESENTEIEMKNICGSTEILSPLNLKRVENEETFSCIEVREEAAIEELPGFHNQIILQEKEFTDSDKQCSPVEKDNVCLSFEQLTTPHDPPAIFDKNIVNIKLLESEKCSNTINFDITNEKFDPKHKKSDDYSNSAPVESFVESIPDTFNKMSQQNVYTSIHSVDSLKISDTFKSESSFQSLKKRIIERVKYDTSTPINKTNKVESFSYEPMNVKSLTKKNKYVPEEATQAVEIKNEKRYVSQRILNRKVNATNKVLTDSVLKIDNAQKSKKRKKTIENFEINSKPNKLKMKHSTWNATKPECSDVSAPISRKGGWKRIRLESDSSDEEVPLSRIVNQGMNKSGISVITPKTSASRESKGASHKKRITLPQVSGVKKKSSKPKFTPKCSGGSKILKKELRCGMCFETVQRQTWNHHSLHKHNYLAWIDGETKLDMTDQSLLASLLNKALKKLKKLTCNLCNEKKASAVGYITHINVCQKTPEEIEAYKVPCTICHTRVFPSSVYYHMTRHTLESQKEDTLRKETQPSDENLSDGRSKRKAATVAEDMFKKIGNEAVSDNAIHLYTKGIIPKLSRRVEAIWNGQIHQNNEVMCPRKLCSHTEMTVEEITKHYLYTCSYVVRKPYKCKVCQYQCESEDDIVMHINSQHPSEEISKDPDAAIEEYQNDDASSESESEYDDDEDMWSDSPGTGTFSKASASHSKQLVKRNTNKVQSKQNIAEGSFRFSFDRQGSSESFLRKSINPWMNVLKSKIHWSESLFPEYQCNDFVVVKNDEMELYLPEDSESCNVSHVVENGKYVYDIEWCKYKLFQSEILNGIQTFWCGASINAADYLPSSYDNAYVAIGADRSLCKSYNETESYSHKGLVQIWNLGCLNNKNRQCLTPASMVMAIAHNYGVVWDLAWCPSGCADYQSDEKKSNRMGLLAVACSNGQAYIYALCHPETLPFKNTCVWKTDPVIELRLPIQDCDQLTAATDKYQATKICWSQDGKHNIMAVGYSNGLVAYFNILTKSPLLCSQNGNTKIINPFKIFQAHTCGITGLAFMPQFDSDGQAPLVVTSYASSSIWRGDTLSYSRSGTYNNIALPLLFPEVMMFSEQIQPAYTRSYSVPLGISSGSDNKWLTTEEGCQIGCLMYWSSTLYAASYQGQITRRPYKSPFISRHRNNKTGMRQKLMCWYTYATNLNSESFKLSDVRAEKRPVSNKKNAPVWDENAPVSLCSYKDTTDKYGLLIVDVLSSSVIPLDNIFVNVESMRMWPLWEQLCMKNSLNEKYCNFALSGSRAGFCRNLFVHPVIVP